MKTIIGIDPGLKGGIAVIDGDGDVTAYPMPVTGNQVNWRAFRDIIVPMNDDEDILVVIEKMQANALMGRVPTFSLGGQFEGLRAVCAVLDISVIVVSPMEWKSQVLKGSPWKRKKGDTKKNKASILYVQQRYPKLSLLPTDKCKVPSDGMADAVCIALWANMPAN